LKSNSASERQKERKKERMNECTIVYIEVNGPYLRLIGPTIAERRKLKKRKHRDVCVLYRPAVYAVLSCAMKYTGKYLPIAFILITG